MMCHALDLLSAGRTGNSLGVNRNESARTVELVASVCRIKKRLVAEPQQRAAKRPPKASPRGSPRRTVSSVSKYFPSFSDRIPSRECSQGLIIRNVVSWMRYTQTRATFEVSKYHSFLSAYSW